MLFPDNIGPHLSIDELSLSQGELYTFVTNKEGRSKKKTLVASIKGTKAADIINVLEKLPLGTREKVTEITLDMAKNMQAAVKSSFPCASLTTDRFHVVKLVIDALQHARIKLRWEALDQENEAIALAKKQGVKYEPKLYSNGDTLKKLLIRSRFILAKDSSKWTENQQLRAEILFKEYPMIKEIYEHVIDFRNIYECKNKLDAKRKMEIWIEKTNELGIKEFNTTARSIQYHLENILNFFDNRNTNAFAESFNSKIKLFRANSRGVKDTSFFLFRIATLFG
jgi:transposase